MLSKIAREVLNIKGVLRRANQVQDAVEAYGDAQDDSEAGMEKRKLQWLSGFTTNKDAIDMMTAAIPNGYNEFDAQKVSKVVKKYPHIFWQFGREYSPVLFCKVESKEDLLAIAKDMKKAKADEIHFEVDGKNYGISQIKEVPEIKKATMRFWWD